MEPDFDLPESLRGEGILVSVIVPTYGDADRLPRALDSVASQTHDNIEVVVVDSSDVEWLSQLADETRGLIYEFQNPRGLSAARNRGIELASGELVAFLDADDYWAPTKIERQLSEIDRGADVVYCDAYIVEGDDRRRMTTLPIEDPHTHYIDFLREGGVPIPTVLTRRECLEHERFDERLDAVEDRNLLVRLFREFTPGRVPEPLAYYVRRVDSMSSDAEFMYENERRSLEFLLERYGDLKPYRAELFARAKYKYGKRLVRTGRAHEARAPLLTSIREGFRDFRAVAVLAAALFPCCNSRLLTLMERAQERVTRGGS